MTQCGEWALRWAIPVLVQAQPPPGHVPLWWFLMCMSASNAQLCALHASPHPILHHCRRCRYFYPLWQRNKQARKVDDLPGWLHQIVKSPGLMLLGSPLLRWQVASAGWPWFPHLKDGWWDDLWIPMLLYEVLSWTQENISYWQHQSLHSKGRN